MKSDAIVAADRDGRIVFWNTGAERIFGHPASAAVGQSLDIIIPEQQRQRHWEGYRRVVQTGASRYGDSDILSVPALKEDGSRISIEFTIAPLRDKSGELFGLVAVMRDVTARFEELRTLQRRLAEASACSS